MSNAKAATQFHSRLFALMWEVLELKKKKDCVTYSYLFPLHGLNSLTNAILISLSGWRRHKHSLLKYG